MSGSLVTVEEAAEQLNLHPKTVLRYIRDGRLPATRIGKSYRIGRDQLDAFAGIVRGRPDAAGARATCIVDIPDLTVGDAERLAIFLHAAALSGDADTPALHLETAFDPHSRAMKVVVIGSPSDAGQLLGMLDMRVGGQR